MRQRRAWLDSGRSDRNIAHGEQREGRSHSQSLQQLKLMRYSSFLRSVEFDDNIRAVVVSSRW